MKYTDKSLSYSKKDMSYPIKNRLTDIAKKLPVGGFSFFLEDNI